MPDPILMTQAALVAGLTAAVVLLVLAWPWRRPHPIRLGLGWTLGLGLGFFVGCGMLGLWPDWPPREDRDRFLAVLLPATILVEGIAAFTLLPGWLVWLARCVLAVAVTPVLLYGTIYLADVAGPGTREWTPSTAAKIVLALAGALILAWSLLERLQARSSARTVGAALFLASAAASVTVMLTGYASGGQLGTPLAGALAGATVISFLVTEPLRQLRCSGVGVVGLFSIILLGRFFGNLPTSSGICLLLAPLAVWIPESPGLSRLSLKVRTVLRLMLVAAPLVLVVLASVPDNKNNEETEYSLDP